MDSFFCWFDDCFYVFCFYFLLWCIGRWIFLIVGVFFWFVGYSHSFLLVCGGRRGVVLVHV